MGAAIRDRKAQRPPARSSGNTKGGGTSSSGASGGAVGLVACTPVRAHAAYRERRRREARQKLADPVKVAGRKFEKR